MNIKEAIKYKNIAVVIAGILSILALFDWDYGYYIFLRWVVLIASALIIYTAHQLQKTEWVIAGAIVLLLFNPIVPVHLNREIWSILNIGAAGMFFIARPKIKLENN